MCPRIPLKLRLSQHLLADDSTLLLPDEAQSEAPSLLTSAKKLQHLYAVVECQTNLRAKTSLHSIMNGKNNGDKANRSDRKTEKTIMDAQVIFQSVICQRRIIKSCPITDNRKCGAILDEEFKSDTDEAIKGRSGSSCHDPPLNF